MLIKNFNLRAFISFRLKDLELDSTNLLFVGSDDDDYELLVDDGNLPYDLFVSSDDDYELLVDDGNSPYDCDLLFINVRKRTIRILDSRNRNNLGHIISTTFSIVGVKEII